MSLEYEPSSNSRSVRETEILVEQQSKHENRNPKYETRSPEPDTRKLTHSRYVRETEILVEQQPPQGVFVCDHTGLVINKFSVRPWRCVSKSGFAINVF